MYGELVERIRKISAVDDASGVLQWDQEVMMPEEGTPARARQLSALSSVSHDLLTADETGRLLDEAEKQELDGEQEAVVREIGRRYRRADRVPNELVEEISQRTSEAHPVWRKAKEAADFEEFAPVLEDLVELKREYAKYVDPDRPAYEVLFEDYEPYLGLDKAEETLETLKDELVPLIEDVAESSFEPRDPFEGRCFTEEVQEELVRGALDDLGYPWSRGRLDPAPHPFSTGNQFDARVTTRYGDDPLDAFTSTVHEFGHALYTLGLPREHYGTPLGSSRDLSVHESQSRLWENHVARSREFWRYFTPKASDVLDVDLEPDVVYRHLNRVYDDNPIRVEADELTYHMHVVVRFEVEQELVSGDLDVREVPQRWNDLYEEYLGLRPEDDGEGCLQDIHWSHGSFGYFPTYSLGSVLAAQIYDAAAEELPLENQVEEGEFEPLTDWLRENVHRHGQRYRTDELVRKATGEEFSADAFVEYVEEKYSELYGI